MLAILKMPSMGRRRGAGAQRLTPKLCPRGLQCQCRCCRAPKGDGEVKSGVLAWPLAGWLCLGSPWWGTEEFCSGMQRNRPLQGFCFQCGDTRFPAGFSGHLPTPLPCWGSKDQADPPVPEGVPGRRSTGRGEGQLSFPRIAFQPRCQAGAAGTLMVQGQSQPLKGRGCIMRGWAGLGRQKPHLLNIYRPPSAGEHSILSLMDVQENTSSTS